MGKAVVRVVRGGGEEMVWVRGQVRAWTLLVTFSVTLVFFVRAYG